MNELTKEEYVTPYGIALIFAGLNDKEHAIHWLQNAYEDRSNWLVWLNLDSRFDNIRPELSGITEAHEVLTGQELRRSRWMNDGQS